MSNTLKWREIASADDDAIETEMLAWAGLRDVWDKNLLNEHLNFVSDVVEYCHHASVELREWDADAPGRSGVWHVIETDDVGALKTELRALVKTRIQELKPKLEAAKEAQEKKLSKLSKGPQNPKYVCTIYIPCEIDSYSIEYVLDEEAADQFRLWANDGSWKITDSLCRASENLGIAALKLVRIHWGGALRSEVITLADWLTQADLEAVG